MASEVFRQHFGNYNCILLLSEHPDSALDAIPSGTTTVRISMATTNGSVERLLVSALDADCQGVVIRCGDAVTAVDSFLKASKLAIRRGKRRLLVLPNRRTSFTNISEIFYLHGIGNIPDILVAMLVDEADSFELVTLNFTGEETWRHEVVVARWRPGSGFEPPSADLFADRTADLQGRQMVFATINYPPYVVLKTGSLPADGTETRILIEFTKKKNATWRVVDCEEDKWGAIWPNGSGNGLLGAVAMDEADAGYAAVYHWYPEYHFVEYTRPYVRAGLTCMAPRPLLQPGWQLPVLPFSPLLWAAVWASVILATVALYSARMVLPAGRINIHLLFTNDGRAVGRYATVEDCFFRSVGLLVLQTPDVERRHTRVVGPTRHVLSWLLIAYLLVTASYGSGLSSVLTIPRYEPPIDSVVDLRDSGLEWAETHIAFLNSLRGRTEQVYLDLIKQYRVLTVDILKSRTTTRDLAFIIERLPGGYFTIGDYIDEEAASRYLRPMREDIYWEYVVLAVPKGWPYIQQLDELIDILFEAGIMHAWEGQVARKWMAPRVQLAAQTGLRSYAQAPDGPVKLQLTHVQGEFALLVLGLCVSLALLLVEIAVHRRTKTIAELRGPSVTTPTMRRHCWEERNLP
ncbi:glutamate receptor ionotropic, kainate 2-like [Schistocerca americana]|uniref:glutamate receptor ionotropic, kainate 2-like n=1 Tax=Schistocerca americana TaxID=7009 RepID=UPI001F4F80DC|nr:glutamate receptor ionotropic, kainate 2-like [Schistocerca americana]